MNTAHKRGSPHHKKRIGRGKNGIDTQEINQHRQRKNTASPANKPKADSNKNRERKADKLGSIHHFTSVLGILFTKIHQLL